MIVWPWLAASVVALVVFRMNASMVEAAGITPETHARVPWRYVAVALACCAVWLVSGIAIGLVLSAPRQ